MFQSLENSCILQVIDDIFLRQVHRFISTNTCIYYFVEATSEHPFAVYRNGKGNYCGNGNVDFF